PPAVAAPDPPAHGVISGAEAACFRPFSVCPSHHPFPLPWPTSPSSPGRPPRPGGCGSSSRSCSPGSPGSPSTSSTTTSLRPTALKPSPSAPLVCLLLHPSLFPSLISTP